jgi:hypothetical protein
MTTGIEGGVISAAFFAPLVAPEAPNLLKRIGDGRELFFLSLRLRERSRSLFHWLSRRHLRSDRRQSCAPYRR